MNKFDWFERINKFFGLKGDEIITSSGQFKEFFYQKTGKLPTNVRNLNNLETACSILGLPKARIIKKLELVEKQIKQPRRKSQITIEQIIKYREEDLTFEAIGGLAGGVSRQQIHKRYSRYKKAIAAKTNQTT